MAELTPLQAAELRARAAEKRAEIAERRVRQLLRSIDRYVRESNRRASMTDHERYLHNAQQQMQNAARQLVEDKHVKERRAKLLEDAGKRIREAVKCLGRKVPSDEICPILLSTFTSGEEVSCCTTCSKVFNKEALHNWLARKNTCPHCREGSIFVTIKV